MVDVSVRKRKDAAWRVREMLTVPNWAIMELLADGKPKTVRQIYSALGKQFTRKTLILSLRTLIIKINVLEPQHVMTQRGYEIGYVLSKPAFECMESMRKLNQQIEKK